MLDFLLECPEENFSNRRPFLCLNNNLQLVCELINGQAQVDFIENCPGRWACTDGVPRTVCLINDGCLPIP